MTFELDEPHRNVNRRFTRASARLPAGQAPPSSTSAHAIRYVGAPLVTRLAGAPDGALLAALTRRAMLAVPGGRETPLAHPQLHDLLIEQIVAGQVMLAERGVEVLGFAAVRARADGDCDIGALFVELDRWRMAVASLLVAHCVDRARVLGARSLHVAGAPCAERFHLGCGFSLTGLEMTRTGVAQTLRMPLGRA